VGRAVAREAGTSDRWGAVREIFGMHPLWCIRMQSPFNHHDTHVVNRLRAPTPASARMCA